MIRPKIRNIAHAHPEGSDDSVEQEYYPPILYNKVYKVGIYGWRKRFLYFLIIFVTVMTTFNAALILWIMRMLDISWVSCFALKFNLAPIA